MRSSPGLIAWSAIFVIASAVCGVLALLMRRAGASLRPLAWFAGLVLLIGAPQFAVHLLDAVDSAPDAAALAHALAALDDPVDGREAAQRLFGPNADPRLAVDAGGVLGDVVAGATVAKFAVLPPGESVVLAQFDSFRAAERAWVAYLQATGLGHAGGTGDSQRGYAVSRPGGDRAFVLHRGTMLGVWTGPDDQTIRRRMTAGGFQVPARAPLEGATALDLPVEETAQSRRLAWLTPSTLRDRAVLAFGVAAWVLAVVVWFLRGAAWAASVPARTGMTPVDRPELESRLLTLNELDVPWRVERGPGDGELSVTWRFAEARWMDLARAHGLRREFRIALRLDEQRHAVHATDYAGSLDWSIGRSGAKVAFRRMVGIQFFQVERARTYGVHLDATGRPTGARSHDYRFDLREMKGPLMRIVTDAGWQWRASVLPVRAGRDRRTA